MLSVSDGLMIWTPPGIRSSSCDEEDGVYGRPWPWLHRGLAVWNRRSHGVFGCQGEDEGSMVAENERWKFQMCPLILTILLSAFRDVPSPRSQSKPWPSVTCCFPSLPRNRGLKCRARGDRWEGKRRPAKLPGDSRVFSQSYKCFLLTPTCRFTFLSVWFLKNVRPCLWILKTVPVASRCHKNCFAVC